MSLLFWYFVAVSAIVSSALVLILCLVSWLRHRNQPQERIDSPPAEVIDFSEALRVKDRTRRGPTVAGPESRERLPL